MPKAECWRRNLIQDSCRREVIYEAQNVSFGGQDAAYVINQPTRDVRIGKTLIALRSRVITGPRVIDARGLPLHSDIRCPSTLDVNAISTRDTLNVARQ